MEGVALLGAFPLVEEEEDEGRWEEEGLDGGLAPPGGGPVVEKVMVGVFHRSAKKLFFVFPRKKFLLVLIDF